VKAFTLAATTLGCLAIALSLRPGDHSGPVINLTPSVPIGLYLRYPAAPRKGNFVLVRPPIHVRQLARGRGYLRVGRLMLKFVAAGPGDAVCRIGPRVWTGGHGWVWAYRNDARGRPLLQWSGCRRLRASERFVLGTNSASFDSRYFGPVDRKSVLSVVYPAITLPLSHSSPR
jgi:conjugative transfer signal peptidase TraF